MKTEKEKYITEFNEVGVCEIDISKVVKDFNQEWFISQWRDDFTLVSKSLKCKISSLDAYYLIGKLSLIQIMSPLFKNGSSWHLTPSNTK